RPRLHVRPPAQPQAQLPRLRARQADHRPRPRRPQGPAHPPRRLPARHDARRLRRPHRPLPRQDRPPRRPPRPPPPHPRRPPPPPHVRRGPHPPLTLLGASPPARLERRRALTARSRPNVVLGQARTLRAVVVTPERTPPDPSPSSPCAHSARYPS